MSNKATAQHHFDAVKHLHDNGGVPGSTELAYHISELGKCYQNSAKAGRGEEQAIRAMVVEADKLVESMKHRNEGKSSTDDPVKP